MKYLFLAIIVIMFSLKSEAQNTWLHISYSWAKDDSRLFAMPTRLSAPIRLHENYDDDNGTFEYKMGIRSKRSITKFNQLSLHLFYGIDYAMEIHTYGKYINTIYFSKAKEHLLIPDPKYHRYFIRQIVIPLELKIQKKWRHTSLFYFGLISNTSFSFEKKLFGTRLQFGPTNEIYLRRKFQFYKVSINPVLGFIYKRLDVGIFWRWKQFSAFDRAIYSTAYYAASNAKAQHAFSAIKYEWFNPFKIGMSLQYRL